MPSSSLIIDERALTSIAKAAVLSVPGTTAVSKVAGRNLPRVDVRLDSERKAANVEAFIAATWPSPVTDLTGVVREAITRWLDEYAGVEALRVNVIVSELVHGPRISEFALSTPPQLFHPAARELPVIEPTVQQKVAEPFEPVVSQKLKNVAEPKVRRGVKKPFKPRVHKVLEAVAEPRVQQKNTARVSEPRVHQAHTARVIEPKINTVLDTVAEPTIADYRVKQHVLKPAVAPGVPEVEVRVPEQQPLLEAKAPRPVELMPIRVNPVDPQRGFVQHKVEGGSRG
ncbi:Asp23/Gls24 family envelope stress response protein [Corynebacterium gerontici]|uniref:Asp23/Gls24 family envelope stress response protein n=1 Tax=Corynebacterium gerontici TaxID=2079234 RepID=A0A3G6J7Z7_9CORY|nr:hypothetical protein [Corynebacterium gerontici]AZA12154.1 hypothetical protein CGERO_09315 [Corynebacterium gerontici]